MLKLLIPSLKSYFKYFNTLMYFDLGNNFIRWVEILIKEREICIRNGGYLSYFFQMERGMRPGCPKSPLLFILTVELFSRNVRSDKKWYLYRWLYTPSENKNIG